MTRKEKRDKERDVNYFFEFIKIKAHFFRDLIDKLSKVKDPRHQSYVIYDPDVILFTMLLKNMADLKSMRDMSRRLNKDECIENVRKVLGRKELEELPHYDTINDFLKTLDISELENIRTYMIKELLKKRCFEDYRIEGKYWGIIFDGTGLHSFEEKHCEHCLKRTYTNKETGETKTVYMHHVLEAKLVVGDMVFSIGTEFIENEHEAVTKQDCEIKAYHRLTEELKKTYPRLPICVLGDSLYACESVFSHCDEYKWKYLFRFKEGRIKSIATEFNAIKTIEQKKEPEMFWVNDILYNERMINLIEAKIDTADDEQNKRFLFLTDIKITKRNAQRLVDVGRSRWKIENQGFNNQKNVRYHIEHVNSQNYRAMKNHYILTQITDILVQLFENGFKLLREFKKTAKEISSNLLEAIRIRRLTDEDMALLEKPIQIRFT